MLEPVLVEALGASPAFGAVTPDARGIRADLRLDTTIEALYQDFRPHPSLGRVALRVRLVDLETGRILATRLFEDSEPAPSNDAYGGVQAINRLLGRLLPEVADFAARAAKTKVAPGGVRNSTPPHEGR
jgi:cholesterol transport system auxiliary component